MDSKGIRAATARLIADKTGECPECGTKPQRVQLENGAIGIFFNHQPDCVALTGINPDQALITETNTVTRNTPMPDWEKKIVYPDQT